MANEVPKHLKNPPPGKNLYSIEGKLRLAKPAKADELKEAGVKVVKKAGDAK